MDDEASETPHPDDAAPQPTSPSGGRGSDPSTIGSSANGPPPRSGEDLRICAGKNRVVQVARAGSRKLFDKDRREVFLEWFAATCNLRLSAGKAGVVDKTIYKHLLKDAAFEEAALRALRLGYVRLEARLMQECGGASAKGPLHPPSPLAEAGPPPPGKLGEDYEIRILDEELAEEHFDPQLALQLLREHRRYLPGSAAPRPAQRTTARAASNKEIAEALAKRLKGFALRVARESKKS
jgi:hypothetical protein